MTPPSPSKTRGSILLALLLMATVALCLRFGSAAKVGPVDSRRTVDGRSDAVARPVMRKVLGPAVAQGSLLYVFVAGMAGAVLWRFWDGIGSALSKFLLCYGGWFARLVRALKPRGRRTMRVVLLTSGAVLLSLFASMMAVSSEPPSPRSLCGGPFHFGRRLPRGRLAPVQSRACCAVGLDRSSFNFVFFQSSSSGIAQSTAIRT
eukprot:RCo047276